MQKFETPAPINAVLDIPAGRIQLIAAHRTDTTVEVRPADPGKSRDVRTAEEAVVSYADGVLRIHTTPPKSQLRGPGALEVTVQLPAGSRIEARTEACELRGVGRLGDVAFEGAYRQIKLDETADLRLTATDGDIRIGRIGGHATVTTARGDITVTEAQRGTVDLRTQAGSITVGAAPGVSATLDAATAHGRISNALRNDGTVTLDIRATTSYGDITAASR
ncbi:hypothetical protein CFP65_0941 [Kitasatospora sp. MMS16-BH015]|uniref:DUF4097 family beta strand repeat-containing protein n=1 Tax=Kitasatospora sp. MMS16-BH015 TaxID=2018025 RepID=UPI000CA0AB35|nr:DUF4097 family beta strand repeat-containing protein [Kitasatospora sp. MMS16-BH015]AUG75861.1 hypothetical protein CFP65_0941 [Kitasatospora sp. MMS16-BH015]